MNKIIGISGTPGVGKTTVAKDLARNTDYEYFSVKEFVNEKKLYSGIKNASKIVDLKELNIRIEEEISNRKFIIDSHLSHMINLVDLIVILRVHPLKIFDRLNKRRKNNRDKYSIQKIRENVEAELVGVISSQTQTHNPEKPKIEIDTTKKTPSEIVEEIQVFIKNKEPQKSSKSIDWLTQDIIKKVNNKLTDLER